MPRAALSQTEVDEFREALCASATRLFAEFGYEGVTMRALAKALGCSPMTPYRYFQNKEEIFEAVRHAAADRFADAIDRAMKRHADHRKRLIAMTRAYVCFGLTEPDSYRIIFELDRNRQPSANTTLEPRSWLLMKAALTEAIEAGVLHGDPNVVGHLIWSRLHGMVALHLAGMLNLGLDLESLVDAFIAHELDSLLAPGA